MADFRTIIAAISAVAEKAAPLVAENAPAAIALAESVIKLVDTAKADLPTSSDQRKELADKRSMLEQSVNAHVDKTTKALRG